MTRGESGSTPDPIPICFPGQKDGITSLVTGNAAGMMHLLSRATLEKKKFSTGKGPDGSIKQVSF